MFFIILGLFLIGVVVYLGFQANINTNFVIWFGLSSAILAPAGISLISYSFTLKDRTILKKLKSVSEVENLMKEAKSKKEKIKILEKERENLEETVRLETKRQVLLERKNLLENNAEEILSQLEKIDQEIERLNLDIESSTVNQQIQYLHKRLKKNREDLITFNIGRNYYEIDRNLINSIFPLGNLVIITSKIVNSIMKSNNNHKNE
jgi:hypothetical protein